MYWGVNCFGHDASICVIENNKVLFHQVSGTEFLTPSVIEQALKFGQPEVVCYYEKPLLKRTRQLYSGEYGKAFNLLTPKMHLMEFGIYAPIKYMSHHHSHAAAAYYTTEFDSATILVADAIGEWDTVSIWKGTGNKLTKCESLHYPFSLGLFYTAFSKLYGCTEKQFMELSVNGSPRHYKRAKKYLHKNLHRGIKDWADIDDDVPCSIQRVFVDELKTILKRHEGATSRLIMTGGCAYNKLAVEELGAKVTINPGDSSSSIGAVAAFLSERIKL